MTRFQKLTLLAAAATLLPIAVGGVVRATGSGDGCPDWPRCFGNWIPPFEYHALIEYSHRTVAAVSGIVLLWLAVVLVKSYRKVPALLWPGVGAFPLVMFQAYLGKLIVENGLSPTIVTVHLAAAMSLGGLLVLVAVNSFYYDRDHVRAMSDASEGPTASSAIVWLSVAAGIATFALMLVGAYLRARDAALAFTDWPLMDSSLLPSLAGPGRAIHFAHRVAALLVGLLLLALTIAVMRYPARGRVMPRLVFWADAFFVAEALVGGANVLARIPPWARAGHVVLATLTWGSLVALISVAYHRRRAHVPLSSATGEPAAASVADRSSGDAGRAEAATVRASADD